MGTAAQRSMSREVHADVGYAHLSIPRVELVVWPRQLGGRPDHKRADQAAEEHGGRLEQSCGGSGGCSGGATGGSGGGADLDVAAAWEDADAASSGAAGAVAGVAAAPAGSESQQQQQWHQQQQQWHDLPVRRALGDSASWQQDDPVEPQSRQASLRLLNSHMASISGRWWDQYGSRPGGGGISAGWRQR